MNMRISSLTRASKEPAKWLGVFCFGQIVQYGFHLFFSGYTYVSQQLASCAIAGVVSMLFIIIGTLIVENPYYYGTHEEREEDIGYHPQEKTYAEYKAEAEAQETAAQESMEEVIPRIYGTD